MTDASETLSLRVIVIAGQRHPDDSEVIWRGIAIGWIMRASNATPGKPRNGRGAATLAGPRRQRQ
jgi:hypothetical protein